jgi:hypothetical protein
MKLSYWHTSLLICIKLEFLATDPEVRVRFPASSDFLRSSGSGTGCTQPREYNRGATWEKKCLLRSRKPKILRCSITLVVAREYRRDPSRCPRGTLYPQKMAAVALSV